MPSSIRSAVRRWNSESTSERRPPQYGQRRTSSVSISMSDFAEMLEHRVASRFEWRAAELFGAEPAPCLVFVDPGDRIGRTHLRAVAAQRGKFAYRPIAHVDDEARRLRAVAERVGGD